MFNHLKTNSTKLAHYILKIQNVIEYFDFQSLMQHPLYVVWKSHLVFSDILTFQTLLKINVVFTELLLSVSRGTPFVVQSVAVWASKTASPRKPLFYLTHVLVIKTIDNGQQWLFEC